MVLLLRKLYRVTLRAPRQSSRLCRDYPEFLNPQVHERLVQIGAAGSSVVAVTLG